MPLRIIRDADNRPVTVYVPDLHDIRRARPSTRPSGRIGFDGVLNRNICNPLPAAPRYAIGLDLAQAHDFTALAIVERTPAGLAVPVLSRTRGRTYPEIVATVARLVTEAPFAGNARLVVDATGVGRPVLDMLRASGLDPVAVTMHGGARVTGSRRAPRVPKRDLINAVLLAMQANALHVAAALPLAPVLARELAELRLTISRAGHDAYAAREGEHDDLVVALALAVWWSERTRPPSFTVPPASPPPLPR
jgi:hypothetical protein